MNRSNAFALTQIMNTLVLRDLTRHLHCVCKCWIPSLPEQQTTARAAEWNIRADHTGSLHLFSVSKLSLKWHVDMDNHNFLVLHIQQDFFWHIMVLVLRFQTVDTIRRELSITNSYTVTWTVPWKLVATSSTVECLSPPPTHAFPKSAWQYKYVSFTCQIEQDDWNCTGASLSAGRFSIALLMAKLIA